MFPIHFYKWLIILWSFFKGVSFILIIWVHLINYLLEVVCFDPKNILIPKFWLCSFHCPWHGQWYMLDKTIKMFERIDLAALQSSLESLWTVQWFVWLMVFCGRSVSYSIGIRSRVRQVRYSPWMQTIRGHQRTQQLR